MKTGFKSRIQAAVTLCAAIVLSSELSYGQQFAFSEKGKKQPARICFAILDHFDGTVLWLKQSSPSVDSSSCAIQPISSMNWEINIQVSTIPNAFQHAGDFQNNNPFNGGPNVADPARIASSIGQKTKDTDLQQAALENKQKQDANSHPQTPPDVDLKSCKTRGTDTIQTTVNGSTVSINGNIKGISDGWVYLQKSGQAQPQRYRMLDIVSITIGTC